MVQRSTLAPLLRRFRWLWIGLAVLLAIYSAVGFLLVPYMARSAIERYVVEDLQRKVSIGTIRFNPFTFTSETRAFSLTEADGSPIASFDLFRMNAQVLSSIFYRAWTFKEVRLDRPDLHAIVDEDGTLNFSRLAPPKDGGTAAADSTGRDKAPIALRIGTLAVHEGRIAFEDRSRTRRRPFSATLTPIEFTLTDFRTSPDFQNAYRFEGSTLSGEQLVWSGQFSIQPLGSSGRFLVTSLKAGTITAYMQEALPFDLPSGSIDIDGQYLLDLSEDVQLSLDLASIKLDDVALSPKGPEPREPWIRLPSVEIADTSLSLRDRTVSVGHARIADASAGIRREADGRLNLVELFGGPAPGDVPEALPDEAQAGAGPEWTFSVGTLDVQRAAAVLEDLAVDPPARLSVGAPSITVSNFSTQPGSSTTVNLDLTTGESGLIAAQGELRLEPLEGRLLVDAAGIDLTPLQPYLAERTALELESGGISFKGNVDVKAPQGTDGTARIAADGEVTVAGLAARDAVTKQALVRWDSLHLSGMRYEQNPESLTIEHIALRKPAGRIVISEDSALNLRTVLNPPGRNPASAAPARTAAAPPTAAPMPVRIRSVSIEDGSSDFSDYSVEPNFAATIVGLNGTVNGLSSNASSRAEVKLTGNVDRYAPVDISGQVNLLSAAVYSDLALNFKNMELTTFNPYSGKYAGYSINKGKLATELRYKVENRRLDAQHHIILDQLEFGSKTDSKDAVPLPVRLAASLLKDRHGVIDINVPVTGSLDDPEFRIGPLIWKAFLGLLTKIVTAPFALLGSLFGGGDELAFIDFAPGSAAIAADQTEKLSNLAKALVERPNLRLDVPLQTLVEADDAALQKAQFDAALAALLADPAAPPADRLAALARLYEQQMGMPPVYPAPTAPDADVIAANIAFLEAALGPKFAPGAAQRIQLSRARADAVQAAVLDGTGVSPERVFLTERESGKTAVPGTARMELKLD